MSILVGWWIATIGALLVTIIWIARPIQFYFQFPMGTFAQDENITGAIASPQPMIQRFVLEHGPSIALVRVSFRTEHDGRKAKPPVFAWLAVSLYEPLTIYSKE